VIKRLSRNVRQPNHVLANQIAGHKAERRTGAGEEWLTARRGGSRVDTHQSDQCRVRFVLGLVRNCIFPNELSLQPTYHPLDVILDKCRRIISCSCLVRRVRMTAPQSRKTRE
jgi:hypothetical protein